MIQPDVEIDDGSGRIILSSEEGETEGELLEFEIKGSKNSLRIFRVQINFECFQINFPLRGPSKRYSWNSIMRHP